MLDPPRELPYESEQSQESFHTALAPMNTKGKPAKNPWVHAYKLLDSNFEGSGEEESWQGSWMSATGGGQGCTMKSLNFPECLSGVLKISEQSVQRGDEYGNVLEAAEARPMPALSGEAAFVQDFDTKKQKTFAGA